MPEAHMPLPHLEKLWTPPLGLFADTPETRAALVRLQMSAPVIEAFAAAVPWADVYMELSGQGGIAEFWRHHETGLWHVPAKFGE